jgi:gliding-associated putative ABC transporter substrate-binding component GldG
MVNWSSRKLTDFLIFFNGVVFLILLNLLASKNFFRIDLTEEKRYTIREQTKDLLSNLEEDVYIEVFLDGDLNAAFKRFRKSIQETLEAFRTYSHNRVHFTFTDPAVAMGQKARNEFMQDLAAKGIQPTNVIDNQGGNRVEKLIFPGALVSYGGFETGVMLLKGNKARTPEEEINQSIEGVEYELARAIEKVSSENRKRIGFVTGHGELDSLSVISFKRDLLEFYDVTKTDLSSPKLPGYDALIIAKPTKRFSEGDKFRLDQYIMQGGKVLFLLDKLEANMDSASREDYFAFPYDLNLDDQLYRYGIRINLDLVQDESAALYPVVTGMTGNKPQVQLMNWPFFPLINRYTTHPITRNMDAVVLKFASSIDTVKAEHIIKTPLLFTSPYTRKVTAPVHVSMNEIRKDLDRNAFTAGSIPLGYLLEGKFTSLYKNRFPPEEVNTKDFLQSGKDAKIIVFPDGDLVKNEFSLRTHQPQPLGFDPFTNYTFATRDLLMNAIAYLVDENGLIQTRSKQIKIRPLDKERVKEERAKWQAINMIAPLVLLVVYGFIRAWMRKRKFAA